MMQTILAWCILATCICYSHEIPVLNADKVEITPNKEVDIISPGYENGQYPYHTKKFWELYARNAKKIQVVFEDVDIEFHHSCLWDSVRVFRSKCEQLTSYNDGAAVLCGVLSAYKFDSESSPICIMFTSDWYINRRGFKARASALTDVSENTENVLNFTTISSNSNKSEVLSTTVLPSKSTYSTRTTLGNLFPSSLSSSSSKPPSLQSSSLSPPQSSSSSEAATSASVSLLSSSPFLVSTTTTSPLVPVQSSVLSTSKSTSAKSLLISSLISSATVPNFPSPSTVKIQSLSTASSQSSVSSSSSQSSSLLSSTSSSKTSLSSTSAATTKASAISSQASSQSSSSTLLSSPEVQSSSSISPKNASFSSVTTTASAFPPVNVVLCQPSHRSIEIGILNEISILSPCDVTGEKYPPNKHCVLTIYNNHQQDIHMMFTFFDIEYNPNCSWDYLELKLGNNPQTRYCGNILPHLENTQVEKIEVTFHSDHIVHKKGFMMKIIQPFQNSTRKYEFINVTSSTTNSSDTTPGFTKIPSSHINSTASKVTLKTTSTKTVNDTKSLEEFTAPSTGETTAPSTKLSSNIPSLPPSETTKTTTISPISSSTSSLSTNASLIPDSQTIPTAKETLGPTILTSSSENAVSYKSYKTISTGTNTKDFYTTKSQSVEYSSTFPSSPISKSKFSSVSSTPEEVIETSYTSPTAGKTLDVVMCEPNDISINIDNLQVLTIRSPQDENTGRYPLNTNCVLNIDNQQKLGINLEFDEFDIEYHPACAWDYLFLKCDNDPAIRMCGQQTSDVPETNANVIEIKFRSDMFVPANGFVLKLTVHLLDLPVTPSTSTHFVKSSSTLEPITSSVFKTSDEPVSSIVSTEQTTAVPTQNSLITSPSWKVGSTSISLPTSTAPTTNLVVSTTSFPEISSPKASSVMMSKNIQTTSTATVTPAALSEPPSLISTSSSISSSSSSEHYTSALNVDICDSQSTFSIENYKSVLIYSPQDANGKYPLNKHCALEVNNSLHENVIIEVSELNIEEHPECKWDYLKLLLGNDFPLFFCGSVVPKPVTTQAERIKVVFHSDFMVSLKGFEMKLTKQSDSNQTTDSSIHTTTSSKMTPLTEVEGTEWPSAEDEDLVEEDVLETPDDSDFIQTTANITTIYKESSESANHYRTTTTTTTTQEHTSKKENDSITVHTNLISSTSLQNLTETEETTVPTLSLENTSNAISSSTQKQNTVNLSTDGDKSNFFTTFTTPITSRVPSTNRFTNISSTIDPLHVGGSGKTIFSSSDTMEQITDGALKTSTVSSSKSTKIINSTRQTTKSGRSTIQTTKTGESTTQTNKTVELTSILTTSLPASVTTSSSGSVNVSNHACSAEMMPLAMNVDFGSITSPGYDDGKGYPPKSFCQWYIGRDESKVTNIIFDDFDVESSPGCRFDKLTFYEINDNGSKKETLTQLCGSDIPMSFSTRKNLLVEFKSDSVKQLAGFKFQFMKVESDPGKVFTCPPGKVPCTKDGSCIPIEWWCDGTTDCVDETDEIYCQKCSNDQLQCGDGTCLNMSNRCDGIPHCSYSTDEQDCVSVTQGNMVTNVDVNIQGEWLPLCHNDVTVQIQDHICHAARFRSAKMLTGEKIANHQKFSVVKLVAGQLTYNKSLLCHTHEVVRLQCSGSDCGIKGDHARKKRIIGGSVSSKGEWPWSVVLRAGNTPICGGSIIENMWILTAGHCVKDLVDNPQILSVITGVSDINDQDRQLRYVSEVLLHPEYHFIFNADIALLRLQKTLVFDNYTNSICLPWDKRQFSPTDFCYITGFGVSDMKDYYTTVMPRYLRHVKTKIVDLEKCKKIYSTRFSDNERIKDNMLCAGYASGGMDACKGDSGGGLMCKTPDDRWSLAGVVSWGDMCGNYNRPGVYTNVVPFIDWIANITNPNGIKNVTCDFEDNGWCGYTDLSTGNYVWTRKPGDKFIKGTILHATKTTSGTNKNEPMTASLLTPKFNTVVDGCLSFSFMFSGNSNITLSVFGIDNSEDEGTSSTLLWRVTSHYPAKDSWKSTEVTVAAQYKQIRFESLSEHGGIVGLGLDNISMSVGQCVGSSFLTCSFNNGNICKYEQYKGQNSKPWSFSVDGMIALMQSEQDLFISAGGDFQTFGYPAMSKLISPKITHEFASIPHCVAFTFKKLTQTTHELLLKTYVAFGAQLINPVLFWSSENVETNKWLHVTTTIHHGVYDHIVFEVKRDRYTHEKIEVFLDDIRVTDGICVH